MDVDHKMYVGVSVRVYVCRHASLYCECVDVGVGVGVGVCRCGCGYL